MEKSCSGSGGPLSLNPQSRAIAKKTFNCNVVAHMHLDSCATENDPARADEGENACKNAGAVRVVQIFNPVLVKTDVANFRLLVQKLTGKSGCSKYVWNKLRRLSYGAAMDVDVDLQELHVEAGAAGLQDVELECINDAPDSGGDEEGSRYYTTRSEQSSIAGAGGGAFSELDIYAGLVSDRPLPDITMLPPLLIHTRSELSLCT